MFEVLQCAIDSLMDLIYVFFLLLLLVVEVDLMVGEVQIVERLLYQLQHHVQSGSLI